MIFSGVKIAMTVIPLVIVGGGIVCYMDLQAQNDILKSNQVKLEESITEQQEVIAMQKQSYEEILVANNELNDRVKELNSAKDELQKKLSEHDINFLAVEKPALIERIINKGSKDVLNDIENLTAE